MLGKHKLIVDEWAEVWDLLKPHADESFWQWPTTLDPDAIYIVGRVLLKQHWTAITEWATQHPGHIVFSNPAEGSETILLQLRRLRITQHVQDGRIGLLTSGDLQAGINYCKTDCYFANIVEYTENKAAQLALAMDTKTLYRPYQYVMLNGRLRPHRKALIDSLRKRNLLDHALWTNLNADVEMGFTSVLNVEQHEPIRLLPPEYEIERAVPNLTTLAHTGFVKHELFGNTWGDAVINYRVYRDSWFSTVTETIFDYPHTFRTEKIWKPMIMGHPFVVAANRGYLRDLRNAGFQTFGSLIDEHYDLMDRPDVRIERITDSVEWLCSSSNAAEFWAASRDICKHNQALLAEYNQRERTALPGVLQAYLDELLGCN
jgi:hypothetical protein